MTSDQSSTQLAANSTINGSPEEQTRLEDALRRADELLATSLKSEERRRWRRNIVIFSLGGLIMLTALGVLLLCWAGDNKPTAADQQKAAQVSQEGWQLWKGQQYGPAIDKFQEAVKLDPKNVNAWNGLGWAQFNSGQIVEAKTSFNKLLELDPKFVAGLNGLGWAQFNSGEYQNSEATFRSLIKIEPTIPGGLNGLGQLYLAQRKYDEAEKYLLKATPQAPAAWYGLARLYLLQGKFDDAAK
jgi:Flp pilus assembly protein TadD